MLLLAHSADFVILTLVLLVIQISDQAVLHPLPVALGGTCPVSPYSYATTDLKLGKLRSIEDQGQTGHVFTPIRAGLRR